MVKKSIVQRQIKCLSLILKKQTKRQLILFHLKHKRIKNSSEFKEDIFVLEKKLQKLPINSSSTRLRNRCWKTGRGRSIYSDFGLSRHVIREMAHNGLLPGVIKASW